MSEDLKKILSAVLDAKGGYVYIRENTPGVYGVGHERCIKSLTEAEVLLDNLLINSEDPLSKTEAVSDDLNSAITEIRSAYSSSRFSLVDCADQIETIIRAATKKSKGQTDGK